MIAETVLAYIENLGKWVMAFWISTGCGVAAFALFLSGSFRYRHFKPCGNPLSRFSQVMVACIKKSKLEIPANGVGLYVLHENASAIKDTRKIQHSNDFRILDRAAIMTHEEMALISNENHISDPWSLCTVSQVEEVKCVLRLLPIWLCTIFYSAVYIQMISLFVEQGAAMHTSINGFHVPPASMTVFDIISISTFIIFYDKLIAPCYTKINQREPKGPSELQRMGIGFVFAAIAMVVAGFVEMHRHKYAKNDVNELSSFSLFWQTPQYVLIGVSEAFMNVAQLEFFSAQIPDGLKSLGVGLCMASSAIGSYLTTVLITIVMAITTKNGNAGWIPRNLNTGHLDRCFPPAVVVVALLGFL